MKTTPGQTSRAIVIGGSLGGLFAAYQLRAAGWDVEIYERSPRDLDSRGGGLALRSEVVDTLRQADPDLNIEDLGIFPRARVAMAVDGAIEARHLGSRPHTSWSLVYTSLRRVIGNEHYHQGRVLTAIEDAEKGGVRAFFADGSAATADLLVGADGGNSTVRRLRWPAAEPTYAGYLAWRGLVVEDAMPPLARRMLHGEIVFANRPRSHILGYLVPGDNNDVRPGHRIFNWVWYRPADAGMLADVMTDSEGISRSYSVPEGLLAPKWREHVYRDAEILPPPFRELVRATREPFAQAIRDLAVDHMVDGRVILVGDAASIPRPHTAASTSKAATNARALREALKACPDDMDRALAAWEPAQVALGRLLRGQGQALGRELMLEPPYDVRREPLLSAS
ncbi:FAD-dependent monooxygenase [Labrys sp. LIt4]|uniref:FAD binding domain-containing protein n=1 Tax=Labrys sp. LIt4 TaxID=2821355 RepID=UPI001ADEF6F2|nr:FAD-dependent monooxygenase [Labrys sp. LIt4]